MALFYPHWSSLLCIYCEGDGPKGWTRRHRLPPREEASARQTGHWHPESWKSQGAGEAGELEEPPIKSGRKGGARRGRMQWRPRGCRKATPELAGPMGWGAHPPQQHQPPSHAAHVPHVHGNAIHVGHNRHSEGEEPSRVTLPDQAPCTLQSRTGWSVQEMRPGGVLCGLLRGLG